MGGVAAFHVMPPKTKGKREAMPSTNLSQHAESDKSDDVTTLNTPLELPFTNAHTYLQKKRSQSAPPVFHLNAASVAKAVAS